MNVPTLHKIMNACPDNELEAWRLYNMTDSAYPLTIDIYHDNAVINIYEKIEKERIHILEKELIKNYSIKEFFFKNRSRTPLNFLPNKQHQKKEITVTENGHKFLCNLSDYQDTGLFLDHRENRQWIKQHSKNKIILNTFAYTGSFTVYAACGGAAKTYSVDLSGTYCDWIRENLKLNNLTEAQNWIYKMDTLEFFKYAAKKNLKFDIIIIDPPTFSKNKNNNFSVQKDHPALINAALALLTPDGFILFSNNYRDFKINLPQIKDPFTGRLPKVAQKDRIPKDFPYRSAKNKIHHCFIIKRRTTSQ
jgi:23S rRNA G2069 N7-methylase RlmK/C1962 C5-methylase RlmI